MKKISYLITIISIVFISNISTASFIQPPTVNTHSTTLEPSNSFLPAHTIKKAKQEDQSTVTGTTFDQELQKRILNLLAQQLFDSHAENVMNHLFDDSWVYATKTFSVSISSNGADFYVVKIIDNQHGKKTQLEIPRL